MRNKKKRVIASILAISILFQAMMSPMTADASLHGDDAINAANTSFLSRTCHFFRRLWPFESLHDRAVKKISLIQDIASERDLSFEKAKLVVDELNSAGLWGGIKSILFNMFFGYASIIPSLLFMTIYGWASQYWNNYQVNKELGNTGEARTPLEVMQNFRLLAAGHKGQEEAKDKLLNIGVYLAYSRLKGIPIRKLIFEVGPPGTGKTTLLEILALALGCGFFNVGASDVDPGSNKSVIDQIFGPRIKRMNNSEYFEDSPVMKFLRATEGQPLRIVAINEFDKLSEKDKKLLLEFLRNAYDNGYAYINGEKINLENVVWALTSNKEDAALFESPSLMSRFEIIRFAMLRLQSYIEILQPPFAILANDFANGHNVHINFGNTILDIAQRLDAGDTGARGVQAYVNTLTSRILNYIYSSENVGRVANKEPIYINVSYDGENDSFIIEEIEAPEPVEDPDKPSESKDEGKDTGQEPPENMNNEAEAAENQKGLDNFEDAMKDLDNALSVEDDDNIKG